MNSLELRNQWAGLVASAREIYNQASNENREPTESEVAEFDKRMADAERVKSDIGKAQRKERLDSEEAELRTVQPRKTSSGPYVSTRKMEEGDVNEIWKAWALAATGNPISPDVVHRAAEQGVNVSSRNLSVRALSKGTTSAGGYTVPTGFLNQLEETRKYYFPIESAVEVLETDNGEDLQLPNEDDTSNMASIVSEAGGIGSSTDMTFGQITYKAWKYVSPIVKVSEELLQDSAINLPVYLAKAFGKRHGRAYDAAVVSTNAGSAAPEGLLHGVSAGVNLATGNVLTWQKLIDLVHSLDIAYRKSPGAAMVMNDGTYAAVKKLADDNQRPLFLNNLQDGIVAKFDGIPIYVSNNMTSIASPGDNQPLILFGDLSCYTWRKVRGSLSLVRLDELYAANGQIGFVMKERVDGRWRISVAAKTLNSYDS